MHVLVESDFAMGKKQNDKHCVQHRTCDQGDDCFVFDHTGIIRTCELFKKLPTGVKVCLKNYFV